MKKNTQKIGTGIAILVLLLAIGLITGCTQQSGPIQATSDSGVAKASVTVQTDEHGHTLEQNNIIAKYAIDNDPATIRYVYLISPMTNKVMLKMTMKGKVTSSGKRLTPITVGAPSGGYLNYAMPVIIDGQQKYTSEVAQDDGTYGTSAEYLYGFSMDGSMQQIYTGGATVIVSTKPLTIQDGVLNMQYVDDKGNPISTT